MLDDTSNMIMNIYRISSLDQLFLELGSDLIENSKFIIFWIEHRIKTKLVQSVSFSGPKNGQSSIGQKINSCIWQKKALNSTNI